MTMWTEHRSLFQPHNWWLGVSLIIFLAALPFVPLVFIPRGKRFEEEFQRAKRVGAVTTELSAAFRDRWVMIARRYELLMVTCVIVLMVSKPF